MYSTKYLANLLVTVLLISCFRCSKGPPEVVATKSDLLIRNVNIVDVVTGKILQDQFILIRQGIIERLGLNEMPVNDSTPVLDGTGKFLIPGLWDMHTHYHWNHSYANNMLIANGVLGIREMWGDMPVIKEIRSKTTDGYILAPEIYSSGSIVDGKPKIWPESTEVENAEEARKEVNVQISKGVDFIKVYSRLSKESYRAIAAACRDADIPFAGHIPAAVTIWEAMREGQQSFEHLYGLLEACTDDPDRLAALQQEKQFGPEIGNFLMQSFNRNKFDSLALTLAASTMWMSPTLVVLRNIAHLNESSLTNDPRLEYMPEGIRDLWNPKNDFRFKHSGEEFYRVAKQKFKFQLSLIGDLEKAGVKIIAGTDYMNPYCFPGFSLHDELQLLVEGGLSNLAALQAATINAAVFMGREDIGQVVPGKSSQPGTT